MNDIADIALAVLGVATAALNFATAVVVLRKERDEKNRRRVAARRRFRGRKQRR